MLCHAPTAYCIGPLYIVEQGLMHALTAGALALTTRYPLLALQPQTHMLSACPSAEMRAWSLHRLHVKAMPHDMQAIQDYSTFLSQLSMDPIDGLLLSAVQQPSDLEGRYGHFLYDPIACRDFVCVADSETLEGSSLPQTIKGAPGKARWSEEERAKKLSRMMAQGEGSTP